MNYSKKKNKTTSYKNVIQTIPNNYLEHRIDENSDFLIELSLEEKKQEAQKPLFIKRI